MKHHYQSLLKNLHNIHRACMACISAASIVRSLIPVRHSIRTTRNSGEFLFGEIASRTTPGMPRAWVASVFTCKMLRSFSTLITICNKYHEFVNLLTRVSKVFTMKERSQWRYRVFGSKPFGENVRFRIRGQEQLLIFFLIERIKIRDTSI